MTRASTSTGRARVRTIAVGALIAAAAANPADAQGSLAARVAAAPEGRVQLTFPARAGVCGDGRSFISIDNGTHIGSFTSTDAARAACAAGPVRVVLERADRQVIGIETFVGPVVAGTASGTTDLGAVSARDAAEYLIGLAESLDGRPGRDAILPAVLAEGAELRDRLAAIARNASRPMETRRTAMSWFGRQSDSPATAARAAELLIGVARDHAQPRAIRQQALSVLGRLEHGAGVPALIAASRARDDSWLARDAVSALARSGDPRARAHTRELVQRAELPDDAVAVAVRGLGGQYGTTEDAALIRSTYARLPGEASRRAAISVLAERGGAANARWLVQLAGNVDERESLRRSALGGARRAGAGTAELAQLYDRGDNAMRGLVVSALAQDPDDAAVAKLLAIARSGDDRSVRRRAVAALARLDDPRVKSALAEIVER